MTPVEHDAVGRVFGGRFRAVRAIKRGGMGAIYVAVDEAAAGATVEVALKVVRRTLADDPEALARFRREARLLTALRDDHVVRALDAGDDDGMLWLAMELLDGITLREHLDTRGRWSWADTLPVVRQIAQALGAVHGLGVVHRDLKPENIMLVGAPNDPSTWRAPRVKLLDFGIAKQRRDDGDGATHMTGTGLLVGTPGYVAPEAVLDGITDDPRSDFYALGVTWFEMLVGAAPFSARTPMALAMRHAHETPPTPSSLLPFAPVPAPVEALLASLLAKRPEQRPADAAAVAVAVDALADAAVRAETPTPAALGPEHPTEGFAVAGTGVLAFPTSATTAHPDGTATVSTPLPALGPGVGVAPSTTTPEDRAGRRGALLPAVLGLALAAGGVVVGARPQAPAPATTPPAPPAVVATTTTTTTTTTPATTTTTPAAAATTTVIEAPSSAGTVTPDPPAGPEPSSATTPALSTSTKRPAPARSQPSTKPMTTTTPAAAATTQLMIVALPRAAGWSVSVDGGPARPTPYRVELSADVEHTLSFSSKSTLVPIVRHVRYPAGPKQFEEKLTP